MRKATPGELAAMLTGTPLVVMLDIDGTLCDIVERADEASVPESARKSLRKLGSLGASGVHVALVTGRSVADARRMVGIDAMAIYGNHGMERSLGDGNFGRGWGSEVCMRQLREAIPSLERVIADFPGTSLEDKDFSLSLHYRAMNQALLPGLESRVEDVAQRFGLHVAPGKRVFNITAAGSADKGDAVREIIDEAAARASSASMLFVGDDVTDEDAFRELRSIANAVTVRIGDSEDVRDSAARFRMDGPREVHQLLALLAESRA